MRKVIFRVILVILVLLALIFTIFIPFQVVYAMTPEDLTDVYAQHNPPSKNVPWPDSRTFWDNNPQDNDAYAQHQRALAQNRPSQPSGSSYYDNLPRTSVETSLEMSNYLIFKRRFIWIFWKRYTGDYSSYKDFKKDWKVNPSIRKQIKYDISKWTKK